MKFRTIDDIGKRVQSITSDNHKVLGKWSAAQNFYHLAAAFEATVISRPSGSPPVKPKVGRVLRWFVTRVKFPPFISIPEEVRDRLEPPADAEFETQKRRLLESIERFREFDGVHPPHPVLGPLTRKEWIGFHLRHCQHHLAFIKVTDESAGGGARN
ncbi:MAG: DUF1569 domain-containing protein [Pirellulaceae bacterium]